MTSESVVIQKGFVLRIVTPPGLDAQWGWILDVILGEWLGVAYSREAISDVRTVCISLAGESLRGRTLTLGADFWLAQSARNVGFAMPEEQLEEWEPPTTKEREVLVSSPIPLLFGVVGEERVRTDLPVDIFGAAFWMLARIEELDPERTDAHDRFIGASSLAARAGFVERPIIDEYVALLRLHLERVFPELTLRSPKFRMLLSHDVDSPSIFGLGMALPWVKSVLRQMRSRPNRQILTGAAKRLWRTPEAIELTDPHNTFDYLMAQSESRGLTSAFYFFGGLTDPSMDARYRVTHPAIGELLKEIYSRGHEIGLHPSYQTFLSPEAIAEEAGALQSRCASLGIFQSEWGGRMHYLRWRWPNTARAWEAAGMDYDSTLGFADLAGFRCGTSHEYTAFDPVVGNVLELRLRPLIAMECSIIAPRYMGLGRGEEARKMLFRLKDRCRCYGGGFSLLWHNSHFMHEQDRSLYESVLDY